MSSELQELQDKIHDLAVVWFRSMTEDIRAGILSHYGDMPPLEAEYWRLQSGPAWCWWVLAILPLEHQAQVRHHQDRFCSSFIKIFIFQQQILSQTHLIRRLENLGKILGYMKRRGCF